MQQVFRKGLALVTCTCSAGVGGTVRWKGQLQKTPTATPRISLAPEVFSCFYRYGTTYSRAKRSRLLCLKLIVGDRLTGKSCKYSILALFCNNNVPSSPFHVRHRSRFPDPSPTPPASQFSTGREPEAFPWVGNHCLHPPRVIKDGAPFSSGASG